MTRRGRLLAITVVIVVVAAGVAAGVAWQRRGAAVMDLVVSPHPDDEMQAWSLIAEPSDTHTVFAFLTRGEETFTCRTDLPGFTPDTGEAPPDPTPQGRFSDACGQARMNSTMAFLEQMGAHHPNLPGNYEPAVAVPARDAPAMGQRCDDDVCDDVGDVIVHAGDGATVIFFDLGDGDLTVDEVTTAVGAIVGNPDTYTLPHLPWRRLIGASYYNVDEPACVDYPHPDHRAVRDALDTHPDGFGESFVAVCDTPGAATVNRTVDSRLWDRTFAVDGDGLRVGPHPVHYGWLLDPYWPNDSELDSQGQLFHRDQYFLHRTDAG